MLLDPRKYKLTAGPRLSLAESVYRLREFKLVEEANKAKDVRVQYLP